MKPNSTVPEKVWRNKETTFGSGDSILQDVATLAQGILEMRYARAGCVYIGNIIHGAREAKLCSSKDSVSGDTSSKYTIQQKPVHFSSFKITVGDTTRTNRNMDPGTPAADNGVQVDIRSEGVCRKTLCRVAVSAADQATFALRRQSRRCLFVSERSCLLRSTALDSVHHQIR